MAKDLERQIGPGALARGGKQLCRAPGQLGIGDLRQVVFMTTCQPLGDVFGGFQPGVVTGGSVQLCKASQREAQPLIEVRVPFELTRQAIDDVERGASDSDWSPVKEAARKIAFAEDRAVFDGYGAAGIQGLRTGSSNTGVALPASVKSYPDAVAQAVSQLRLAGCEGPYALVLGADAYTAASGGSDEGYPVLHHIERIVDGGVIWAPALKGGFLLTTRGGDFELDIGQDFSIGYLSHSSTTVELYLQESFTFRLLTTEASVVLTQAG